MSDPDAPPLDPDALISALERHEVSFVAVGGLAAQWHGAQRTTKDLDVCPAWDKENLDHVAGALRDLGARLKVPDGPAEGEEFPVDALGTHLVVGFVDEIAELGDPPNIDPGAADLVAVG